MSNGITEWEYEEIRREMSMKLNQWQRVIEDPRELSTSDYQLLFWQLLQRLHLCVVEEATPDYRSLELEEKARITKKD